MGTLFITRRILGPEKTGIWNLIQTISSYAVTVNSGVESGAEREIPYWHGRGDTEQEVLARSQMFSSALLESTLSAIVLGIFAVFTRHHYRHDLVLGIVCAAVYVILWRISGCYLVALRTTRNFVLIGKSQIIFAFIDFITGVGLVYGWKLTGQCISFGIGLLLRIVFYHHLIRSKDLFGFRWHFTWQTLKPLLALGFPLVIGGFFWQLLVSIDSLIVAKLCGITALGYYSIGLSAGRSVAEIPSVFSTVVFPQMILDYGRNENPSLLGRGLYRNLESVVYFLGPFLLCFFYFLFPLAVRHYLKQFELGIPTIKILILSGFFISLTHFPGQLLTTQKKVVLSSSFLLVATALTSGLAWISSRWGIWYVAVSVTFSYGVYFTLQCGYAFYSTLGLRGAWRAYAKLLGGIVYIVLILGVVDHSLPLTPHAPFIPDLLRTLHQVIISMLCFLPLFWKAEHDLSMWSKLRTLWTERQ